MTKYINADALKIQIACVYGSNPKYLRWLNDAPAVDAEPVRHGKWITEECLPGVAVCSNCGHEIRGIGCQYTKYCDECGARMDAEGKEE